MKYIATTHIPTTRQNRNVIVFSEKYALKQLEEMKKKYSVIDSQWIDDDLVIRFEIEV